MHHHSLAFTPDASRVVVRSAEGLHVADLGGRAPSTLVRGAIDAFATIEDEIWLVEAGALRRVSLTGAPRGEAIPLWGGDGRLVRAAGGALWTAAPHAIIGPAGVVARLPECDHALPVSASRWLICGPGGIALREPTAQRWATAALGRDARVTDGAVLFGGRSAALVVTTPDVRQLVVVGLHDGTVQHRLTLVGVDHVRFAPARGTAVLLAERRRVMLVDLRFGRILKDHVEDRDVADLAIDEAAQHLAFRYGDRSDDVVHVTMRDFLASSERPVAADVPPPEPVVERAAACATVSPVADARWYEPPARLRDVAAIAPRPQVPVVSPARSAEILEEYRRTVTALVGRAIAQAWDHGRLTFAGEGALPFRTEVAGLLGLVEKLATDEVSAAQTRVVEALAMLRDAEAVDASGAPPLLAMAHELGLSGLARQILLVVAGPALWGNLARLYGILANDEARPLCDELLVAQILDGFATPAEVARELDRSAPLVRHGLVRIGEGMRPFVALSVDPLVPRLLRGEAAELDDVRVVSASVTFDDLLIPAATKADIARQVARPLGRVVVRGRAGSGRHTLLAAIAGAAGRRIGLVDATPYLRDLRGQVEALRTTLRRAHLLGLVPCLDGLENLASDDAQAREMIREVIRQHPGPLAIRLPWNAEAPLDAGFVAIDLPQLSVDQRLTAWQAAIAAHGLYVREPLELAQRYRIGPGLVVRACAQVAAAGEVDRARDVAAELEVAVRQHLEARLGTTATRVTRLATWSQVVLPADIQDSVLELIARIKHRRVVYDVWGYDRIINTARGVTALLQGGPGTGKTLVASAIASELGMDLYRVDLSRIMSKWIGETEQNLAKLFDAAEDGHAIVLFDEADSLFGKRTEVRSSVDRFANLAVNYLLQRLDSFEGIAILTTNFGTAIDAAFRRRMSFRLTFPFPDEDAREQLWKAHISPALPVSGYLDLGDLARRYRMSGGYIRNAVLRAAFLAAEETTPLTQDHLERAVRAEFREIGKLAESGVLE